jgi:hypothetical protein
MHQPAPPAAPRAAPPAPAGLDPSIMAYLRSMSDRLDAMSGSQASSSASAAAGNPSSPPLNDMAGARAEADDPFSSWAMPMPGVPPEGTNPSAAPPAHPQSMSLLQSTTWRSPEMWMNAVGNPLQFSQLLERLRLDLFGVVTSETMRFSFTSHADQIIHTHNTAMPMGLAAAKAHMVEPLRQFLAWCMVLREYVEFNKTQGRRGEIGPRFMQIAFGSLVRSVDWSDKAIMKLFNAARSQVGRSGGSMAARSTPGSYAPTDRGRSRRHGGSRQRRTRSASGSSRTSGASASSHQSGSQHGARRSGGHRRQ